MGFSLLIIKLLRTIWCRIRSLNHVLIWLKIRWIDVRLSSPQMCPLVNVLHHVWLLMMLHTADDNLSHVCHTITLKQDCQYFSLRESYVKNLLIV